MIIDLIENADKYSALHPLFSKAFDFLKTAGTLPVGRYELEGNDLFVIVSENELRQTGELEAHRKYIDIQLVLSGKENFQCSFTSQCKNVSKSYDEESDIMFFRDEHKVEYSAEVGTMSIFFPEDAHAPLISTSNCYSMVKKAIAKVRVL